MKVKNTRFASNLPISTYTFDNKPSVEPLEALGAYGVSAHIDVRNKPFCQLCDRCEGAPWTILKQCWKMLSNGVEPEVIDRAFISFVGKEIRPLS